MKHANGGGRLRAHLAHEAARIMAEEGVSDFRTAKRKAASRLGLPVNSGLPRNSEVEDALRDYQRLFQSRNQWELLRQLRSGALQAMEFLDPFRPRLAGPVLNGTANAHASISLHLFAESPEEVMIFLMEHRIPYEQGERRYRLSSGATTTFPVYEFSADDVPVRLTVFPPHSLRQAPLSPVDGKPIRRATRGEVESLLQLADEEMFSIGN